MINQLEIQETKEGNKLIYVNKNCIDCIIPNGVTEICKKAFQESIKLETVIIPASVKHIKEEAFYNCVNLKKVIFEKNSVLEKIEFGCFCNCKKLKEIDIPNSVKQIRSGAFQYCYSLKKVTLPNSITEIFALLFNSCISLKEIEIPKSVTEINRYTFNSCVGLKSIVLPKNLDTVYEGTFNYCALLKRIKIQNPNLNILDIGNAFIYTPYSKVVAKAIEKLVPKPTSIRLDAALKQIVLPFTIKFINEYYEDSNSILKYVENGFLNIEDIKDLLDEKEFKGLNKGVSYGI